MPLLFVRAGWSHGATLTRKLLGEGLLAGGHQAPCMVPYEGLCLGGYMPYPTEWKG